MEKRNFLNKRIGAVGARAEVIELFAVVTVILVMTLILPLAFAGNNVVNNQFLVGATVNCALIIAGISFRGILRTFGIVFLPSVIALLSGLILSMGSVYMLYMIPAIWLGNASVVFGFKYLYTHKKLNFALTSAIIIALKAGFIFAGYNLLLAIGLIPAGSPVAETLFTAMGLNQLITATLGCIAAFGVVKISYRQANS